MTFGINSIETTHKGVRFRSRTEARWSIFFDVAGIPWRYEPEGFEFDGERYVPDFWLPREEVFFEVKGGMPSDDYIQRVARFSEMCRRKVLIAIGAPSVEPQVGSATALAKDDDGHGLVGTDYLGWLAPDRWREDIVWLTREPAEAKIHGLSICHGFYALVTPTSEADDDRWPCVWGRFEKAYEAAQKHRFDWR